MLSRMSLCRILCSLSLSSFAPFTCSDADVIDCNFFLPLPLSLEIHIFYMFSFFLMMINVATTMLFEYAFMNNWMKDFSCAHMEENFMTMWKISSFPLPPRVRSRSGVNTFISQLFFLPAVENEQQYRIIAVERKFSFNSCGGFTPSRKTRRCERVFFCTFYFSKQK